MRAIVEDGATLADLLEELGDISPKRVRYRPPLGRATVKDVVKLLDRENRLFELVEGVLVEKAMGYYESRIAAILIQLLQNFLDEHDFGIVAGADGTLRLAFRLVRIPDVSFVSWDRLPNREIPAEPVPKLVPNLAVEVLSEGNTVKEMKRKIQEYFTAGVQLVWVIDPRAHTVQVFTAPDRFTVLEEKDTLDGGNVLPGFTLSIRQLFARVGRVAKAKAKTVKKPRPRGKRKTNGR